MDGQKKLTRTQSSLLRSSPTVRSSIHSLSSIESLESGEKEEKLRMRKQKSGSTRFGATGSTLYPVVAYISTFTILFLLYFYIYLGKEEIPTSESLLLFLILIAVTLFLASKNQTLIHQTLATIKQLWGNNSKRFDLGLYSKGPSRQVQWFIGGNEKTSKEVKKRVVKEGVEVFTNGDFYEGEFHRGKCNGSGVYYFFVKGKYEGDWIDGRYDGYGVESWAKGSRYKGQYRQGLRHGYGVYRFYTGDSYTGQWFNGQSHGVGVQTCADGSCYVGEFKLGVKHGLGCYHFRNGDRYAGEYFGDKIHGFGVYHFANGHCYEGSWHEGRKQGYGMYTFRNGVTKCGEWDAGNLKTPFPPLTDVVLRAVQAARKTAENAINLGRVDEQVSKAVMAANKAATAARVAAVKAVQNQIDGRFCDMLEV